MTKPEDQMKFQYFAGEQRTPEWYALRLGKVTASRLDDWLAVSKAKATLGSPLKARLDYERELMFEREFGTSFERFVTPAMQDGIDFEDFVRRQYVKISGNAAEPCGAWYSDVFVASPDATVGDTGLLEIKVVGDNTFTEILQSGVPDKWQKQIQGQMWASKREWTDFAAMNLHTKKLVILTVKPDEEFHDWLELIVPEPMTVAPFELKPFDLPDEPERSFNGLVPGNGKLDQSKDPKAAQAQGEW